MNDEKNTTDNFLTLSPRATDRFFYGPAFSSKLFGDELMAERTFIARNAEELFCYNPGRGIYEEATTWVSKQVALRLIYENRRGRAAEVLHYLKGINAVDSSRELDTPPHFLVVKNGVLNTITGELGPFDSKQFFVTALPVEYKPGQDCPKIKAFIQEVTEDAASYEFVLDFVAYCLYRGMPLHKYLILIGEGSNGKGVLILLVKRFLGEDNVTARSIQSLEARFATAGLFGKLANLYPDLSDAALKETGTLKMLTGGDYIEAELKGIQKRIKFTNHAKMIFSANKLPETPDDTDGFFRRPRVIRFPKQFLGDKANPNLIDELTTPEELSGLLNECIRRLPELLNRRVFLGDKTIAENRSDYEKASSPEAAFCEDCIDEKTDGWLAKDAIRAAFNSYCVEKHLPAGSDRRLFTVIGKKFRAARESRKGSRNDRQQGITGLVLVSDSSPPQKPDTGQQTLDLVSGFGIQKPDTEPKKPDTEPQKPDTEPQKPDAEPQKPDTEPQKPDTNPPILGKPDTKTAKIAIEAPSCQEYQGIFQPLYVCRNNIGIEKIPDTPDAKTERVAKPPRQITLWTLHFQAHCNAFVGDSAAGGLENYGPFKPGDVAAVPADSAKVLVDTGQARRVPEGATL